MPIYQAIYDGPPNNYTNRVTSKRWITIHCTANDASAENEAAYAKRRTDDVSSHYYVDHNSIAQSLNTDLRAWHAGSSRGNDAGIAYEITALGSWSRLKWLSSVAWDLLVAQIRKDLTAHDIPVRDLTPADLDAGRPGITTHNEMRLAFGGTDHTCPGPNFPMDHLIRLLLDKEDDMPTAQEIAQATLAAFIAHRFDRVDGSGQAGFEKSVEWARQHAGDVKADVSKKVLPKLDALIAANEGLDTEAVLARIDQRAAEDAARDTALLALLEEHADGSLDAEQVVRRLGELLTAPADEG